MQNKKIFLIASSTLAAIILMLSLFLLNPLEKSPGSLTGAFSLLELSPEGFVYREPGDVSPNAAKESLDQALQDITDMKEQNFVTLFVQDAYREADKAYTSGDYTQVFKLTQLIGYVKSEKIKFLDKLRLLEIKKQGLEDNNVQGISKVNDLSLQAINAFSLDQLDRANELLDQANEEARSLSQEHNRLKLLSIVSKNFFLRYWWQNLILLVILAFAAPRVYKYLSKKQLAKKISNLQIEQKETKNLIKRLQKECFVDKAITPKMYKERAAKYEERITEIRHTIPVLQAQLKGRKKPKTESKLVKSGLKLD